MPILLSLSRLCQTNADVPCRFTSGALALQCLLFGLFMMAAVRMSQAQDHLSVQRFSWKTDAPRWMKPRLRQLEAFLKSVPGGMLRTLAAPTTLGGRILTSLT